MPVEGASFLYINSVRGNIENHDTGKFRTIAKSLYELINELKPSIIDFDI